MSSNDELRRLILRVIAQVKDYGEDALPDSEYRLACNDLVERFEEWLEATPSPSPSTAGEVRVRKLEWVADETRPETSFIAHAVTGEIRIFQAWWGKFDKWGFVCTQTQTDDWWFHTLEDAQSAAQSHYEAAIRSAIDSAAPAPAHAQEPVAWLHPTAGWSNVDRDFVAMHCLQSGPFPTPLYASPPSDRHAEITAEIERLREALKPFATIGDGGRGSALSDDAPLAVVNAQMSDLPQWLAKVRGVITQGDVRRARAALDQEKAL